MSEYLLMKIFCKRSTWLLLLHTAPIQFKTHFPLSPHDKLHQNTKEKLRQSVDGAKLPAFAGIHSSLTAQVHPRYYIMTQDKSVYCIT